VNYLQDGFACLNNKPGECGKGSYQRMHGLGQKGLESRSIVVAIAARHKATPTQFER
jgi:hypothetical protein